MMKLTASQAVSVTFGALMILLVTAGGLVVAFTDAFDDRLYGAKRIFFVILMLSYAVYRGFRLRQLLRISKQDK